MQRGRAVRAGMRGEAAAAEDCIQQARRLLLLLLHVCKGKAAVLRAPLRLKRGDALRAHVVQDACIRRRCAAASAHARVRVALRIPKPLQHVQPSQKPGMNLLTPTASMCVQTTKERPQLAWLVGSDCHPPGPPAGASGWCSHGQWRCRCCWPCTPRCRPAPYACCRSAWMSPPGSCRACGASDQHLIMLLTALPRHVGESYHACIHASRDRGLLIQARFMRRTPHHQLWLIPVFYQSITSGSSDRTYVVLE